MKPPGYLCSLQDEVMNDDLLSTGKAQPVFVDKGDGERQAVHGLFSTGPVNKLILGLNGQNERCAHILK